MGETFEEMMARVKAQRQAHNQKPQGNLRDIKPLSVAKKEARQENLARFNAQEKRMEQASVALWDAMSDRIAKDNEWLQFMSDN